MSIDEAVRTYRRQPRSQHGSGVVEHLVSVDSLLGDVLADLDRVWKVDLHAETPADILGHTDLPVLLRRVLATGGKRLRPVMIYLGWLAARGRARRIGHGDVVTASAALELLHLFALVHDDVMDSSDSRRGRPTTHRVAAEQHRDNGGTGDAERFGESIAILVGDLAHSEADQLAAELPPAMRRVWRLLVVELIYGQRRDLTGCAAGSRDLEAAREVARLKSGGYTVTRPLQLGAVAARAPEVVTRRLICYGREVGEAFALRDDLLGVWGDPEVTGKPAGDDLISGKPTVIVALGEQRLAGPALTALGRIGTPALSADDIAFLQEALIDAGVVAEVEETIGAHVRKALSALEIRGLDPAGVSELTRMANQIAWRDT